MEKISIPRGREEEGICIVLRGEGGGVGGHWGATGRKNKGIIGLLVVVVAMPAVLSPWRLVNVIGGRICYNARDLESDVPSQ